MSMKREDKLFVIKGIKGHFFTFNGNDCGPFSSKKDALSAMSKLFEDYKRLLSKYKSNAIYVEFDDCFES